MKYFFKVNTEELLKTIRLTKNIHLLVIYIQNSDTGNILPKQTLIYKCQWRPHRQIALDQC